LRQRSIAFVSFYLKHSFIFSSYDVHLPAVAAAWSLTAFRSRLKALSSTPVKADSELANRRWKGVRMLGERS
jgi:hypothetical protein